MSDRIKVILMILLLYLVLGMLFLTFHFLTRNNAKRQLYIAMPILLPWAVWFGCSDGWKIVDFVRLGLVLLPLIVWLLTSKIPAKK